MTAQEKQTILDMRNKGKSYAEIARETGLARSTISSFCNKSGLNTSKNNLQNPLVRGNTEHTEKPRGQRVPAFWVTLVFAEEPNEAAVAEALRILANVR